MGVSDLLFIPAPSPCPQCGAQEDLVIQFHFGDVYLNKFRVGDTMAWSDRAQGAPGPAVSRCPAIRNGARSVGSTPRTTTSCSSTVM